MAARSRRARLADVHELALGMPHVTIWPGSRENPIYQVGGKSFVFFRNPRPDAVDPVTGERYPDVIVFWVPSESDKQALVQDPGSPFFTTPHFDGHPSVLVRGSRIGELTVAELTEVIEDAWLSRASRARAAAWLSSPARQLAAAAAVTSCPGSFLIARTAQHRQFLCQELAQSRRRGADVRDLDVLRQLADQIAAEAPAASTVPVERRAHRPGRLKADPETRGAFPRNPAPRHTARTGTRPHHQAAGS